jgi:mannan endo-1,4-beta-mannosidase
MIPMNESVIVASLRIGRTVMEPRHLDPLTRALSGTDIAPSRRGLIAGLAGGVAGLTGLSLREADAKKHKGKHKKKCKGKKKRGRCKGSGGNPTPYDGPVFTVSGRGILDTDGDPVQLRGVNKMSVFDDDDPRGNVYFPQIALSHANTVRIVWAIVDDHGRTDVADLAAVIANCQKNKMLPMIELHDATGDLSKLPKLADYWTRSDVLQVIFNAGGNLLVNIGNEVGDDTVGVNGFINAYTPVIRKMRNAGIRTPLVIDAPDFGKNIDVFTDGGAAGLLDVDPNLIFSVHTYWGISDGADANFIKGKFDAAVNAGYALIVGEFSKWGAFNPTGSVCEGDGECAYNTIMTEASARGIGWYAWEWGPGNEFGDDTGLCTRMNMTTDGTFASLQPGWATDVVNRIMAEANPILG